MKGLILLLLLAVVGFVLYKNLTIPAAVGLSDGRLKPCADKPGCYCSQDGAEPLGYVIEEPLEEAARFLQTHYIATVTKQTPTYLHVVVTTPYLRFNDDLELLVVPDERLIHFRSCSRVGYEDFGMNKKRIETLREHLTFSITRD